MTDKLDYTRWDRSDWVLAVIISLAALAEIKSLFWPPVASALAQSLIR